MKNNGLLGKRIWLFCRVIDHYGDAAIAWRLARILAHEMRCVVSLFIDDLQTLHALHPAVKENHQQQVCDGISILFWDKDIHFRLPEKTDCVIEMFACTLPESVCQIIVQENALWLNWEYLTAEEWALSVHGLPSLQNNGSTKYFYLMGFDKNSGGLLREKTYTKWQQHFSGSLKEQANFRLHHGLPEKNNKQIFLIFSYSSDVYFRWLSIISHLNKDKWEVWLAGNNQILMNEIKKHPTCAQMEINNIPFVAQTDFDALLTLCDMAVVRGEDSFVRAQYAALPFFWHIYPQAEQAHLPKLAAFWQQIPFVDKALADAHQALSLELNSGVFLSEQDCQASWKILLERLPEWQKSMRQWQKYLFSQPSACEKLAYFWQKRLK